SVNPGYQKYEYKGNITLQRHATDWRFSYSVCCRNCAITTLVNPCGGSSDMYVEATLNSIAANGNSSPTFTNIPVAFICANQSFTYNHGVVDANGDSLVYQFIDPLTSSGPVTFNAGYSASQFLLSSPAVSLNSQNGDIVINSTQVNEVGVTAIRITEYRNGVAIGSVVRDMQFRTVLCNPNLLPTASGINGTTNYSIYACPGSTLNFVVNSNDANAGQSIVMTWNNVIPGATFTPNANAFPTGTFNWAIPANAARSQPYSFVVSVRDNNCPLNGFQSYSYQIFVPVIDATITGTQVSCSGGANGTATASGFGGVAPYTYSWNSSPVQTTATATGLPAGNYNVIVTDANGCSKTFSRTVTQPTALTANVSSSTNVACNGGTNGTATVTVNGGTLPYTYAWSPSGGNAATTTGRPAGNYTCTVTDALGCTQTPNVTISQPTALSSTTDSLFNVSCNGQADGRIYISVSGGTAGYTYAWSNGATTQDISGLAPGNYTCTITDANGCNTTRNATITQPGAVVPTISSSNIGTTNVSCNGGNDGTATINVTGGTMPYTYVWNNGQTNQTATGLSAGSASVTITDANGCSAVASTTLLEPDPLVASVTGFSTYIGGANISCNGASDGSIDIDVIGGTSPYDYAWSNGDTTQDINGLSAGNYTVTVTDDNGCITNTNYTLNEPAIINPTIFSPVNAGGYNIGCRGENSGSIDLTVAGGTGPYTYLWSTAATTQDLNLLFAGFYDVDILDANGCMSYDSITLIEPDTVVPLITSATITGGVNVSCAGSTDGTAYVTVTGGTPSYTYQWSIGGTADTAYNVGAGPISVTVRDANGCSAFTSAILTEPDPLAFNVVTSDFNGFNVSCFNGSNGTIDMAVSGGVPPYDYAWSTGDTTQDIFNIPQGNYFVIVTDINGCRDSIPVAMIQPDSMDAVLTATDFNGFAIACNGGSNGSIDLTASGGVGVLTYLWNNAATTEDISNIAAGSYSVTVTDQNGCTKIASLALSEPPALNTASILSDFFGFNISCNGYTDGQAILSASGGVAGYTFTWNGSPANDTVYGIAAGTYSFSAIDTNGCVANGTAVLIEPTPISLTSTITNFNGFNVACHGDTTACIDITASGGVAPYQYEWSDESYLEDICNLGAGAHWVIITDTNNCQRIDTLQVTQPDSIVINAVLSLYPGNYNISCNGLADGSIDLTILGGVAPFNYTWIGGDTTQDLTGLVAGTYDVSLVDLNGCINQGSFNLIEPTAITSTNGFTPTSCGVSNGTAWVTVAGGDAPYSYAWNTSPIQTNDTAINLAAANYIATITDALGCTHIDSVLVNNTAGLSGSIAAQSNSSCNGLANGTAIVSVTGGSMPYSFSWNTTPVQNTDTATGLSAGNYTCTITDNDGCTFDVNVTISQPNVLQAVNGTLINAACNGATDGSATVSVTGGTTPYTYSWNTSPAQSSATAVNLAAGTYVCTVTDSLGCTANSSFQINEPALLTVQSATTTDILCNGGNNGALSINISGGTGTPTIIWNTTPAQSGTSATNLTAGIYSAIITDQNNCSLSFIDTIVEPTALSANIAATTGACQGGNTGTATVTTTGGTAGYSYSWNTTPIQSSATATGLAANTYIVTVTDANNCSTTATAIINTGSSVAATVSAGNVTCFGYNDGSILLSVAGATQPITYLWNNGATTADINNLSPNSYSVNITDANGCTATASATISEPNALITDAGLDSLLCEQTVNLSAQLNSGESGSWSIATGTGVFSNATNPNATFSNYNVGQTMLVWTITDGTCFASDTTIVTLRELRDCVPIDLELPTGFTPNGDGENDGFYIQGLERYPENTFQVFNRWGNLVYEVENYTNASWLGTNTDNAPLPDATYFVILKIKNSTIRKNGYVDLRR
ncbi:MAG: hypothetical protein RIQ89_653, partial [Bacteroidota bacterium]